MDKIDATKIIQDNVTAVIHVPKDGQVGSTYVEDEDNEQFFCIHCGEKMETRPGDKEGIWVQHCSKQCVESGYETSQWKDLCREAADVQRRRENLFSEMRIKAFPKAKELVVNMLKSTIVDLEEELNEKKEILTLINENVS